MPLCFCLFPAAQTVRQITSLFENLRLTFLLCLTMVATMLLKHHYLIFKGTF